METGAAETVRRELIQLLVLLQNISRSQLFRLLSFLGFPSSRVDFAAAQMG